MFGLWIENQSLTVRRDLPLPEPGPHEALVRVHLAGICGTDLAICRGYTPFAGILGHEFVGEVVAVPSAKEWVGQRVVGEINLPCRKCKSCLQGRMNHCEFRTVLGISGKDGSFAEYLTLPLTNLHRVPSAVSDEQAVFCEPIAAALEILEQVHVRPSHRVLLVGSGRLGQLIARVLSLTGCELFATARRQSQHALLSKIATVCKPEKLVENFADIVVEATGAKEGFDLARRAVRPRGTIVLKSTFPGETSVNFSHIVVDEISLVASRCGPFAPALRLLERGLLDPLPMIQERFPLSEGIEAFHQAAEPGVLKVLLDCKPT